MRSVNPMPGDAWPHDMLITVEDQPRALLELLWLRAAWALDPVADDLPPSLVDPPEPAERASAAARSVIERAAWSDGWPSAWHAAVAHAATPVDAGLFDAIRATADGSDERRRLLAALTGPDLRATFGAATFEDASLRAWFERMFSTVVTRHQRADSEPPERTALEALVPAWQAGLTRVVTLPCVGEYTRVIGPHALLVTDATRSAPDRYAAALAQFAGPSAG